MWILCLAEDSFETLSLIFSEKLWKSSAAVVTGALRVKVNRYSYRGSNSTILPPFSEEDNSLKMLSLIYCMVTEINISTKFRWAMCYSFINNCIRFEKMYVFSINTQWKIIFRIKCRLPFSSWRVRISILITCVIWLCTGNVLIRALDCDVWINYFCPMSQFRSRSAIVLKFILILCVKLVLTNSIF